MLTLLAATGAVLFAGRIDLWPGGGGKSPGTPEQVRVTKPYALVEVFPRREGAGRAEADAALARLTAAGMPVRLVDSTQSPDVADGPGGLFVLLQDGFPSVEQAQAYCNQFRAVAPRCDVVP